MGAASSKNALNKAQTATLRNALEKYIAATKNLKNKSAILSAINNKPTGSIRTYRNMIANGVANAVAATKKANVAVAAANVGAVSETEAAAHVNNAAKQINNLKQKVEASSGAASIPLPRGIGGALHGVTKGNNNNNSTKNVNRNYVLAILKNNATYKNNKSKINAIVAYNPGLNFSKLARNNNNAKIKNLLAQANSIKKFKQGPAQHTGYNIGNTQGGNLTTLFGNTTAEQANKKNNFNKVLNNTKNNKLKSTIKNNAQANALAIRVRNAALAAGKNVNTNKNVKNALARINAHKTALKSPKAANVTNYNTRKRNIGNYIWGRAHGGLGGLAINTNYSKIAAETKIAKPGFTNIKRENLNAYINSKPKSGQQTERAKAILNVLFAPQSSN